MGTEPPKLEGKFTVREKMTEPVYHGPAGRVIAAGDPMNPLGKLRIGLNEVGGDPRHKRPGTDRFDRRSGPLCLGDRDIDDVFDILSVGSQVVIRR